MTSNLTLSLTMIFLLVCIAAPALAQSVQADLPSFETRYYVIHTDLTGDDAREAALRMTAMAEEYHRRTSAFSGAIRKKLDFYLFKEPQDYFDAGGHPGSAGVFARDRLMAIAGNEIDGDTWHVVQHEGFHQFAHAVIGGELPIWINEGLAEYFGEGLFTGDHLITGVIPPWRLERIKESIKRHQFIPLDRMMRMTHHQWNRGLSITNYDQAWTMVHFLAHGEEGAFQKAFNQFMIRIGRNQPWERAWSETFGDAGKFEQRWSKWWSELAEGPTSNLYHRATVLTITSFLARATAQQQKFATFDDFLKAADEGTLNIRKDEWLPPILLADAVLQVRAGGTWSIESPAGKPPSVVFVAEDESKYIGNFTLSGGRVKKVWAEEEQEGGGGR